MHQVVIGVIGYTSDWDGNTPPPVARGGRPSVLNRHQDNTSAYRSLGSYLEDAELFNCPVSSFASYKTIETPGGDYSYQKLYENPANDRPGDFFKFTLIAV